MQKVVKEDDNCCNLLFGICSNFLYVNVDGNMIIDCGTMIDYYAYEHLYCWIILSIYITVIYLTACCGLVYKMREVVGRRMG